jgi:hypothetical protein
MQRGSRLRRKCEERSVEALSFAYAHKPGCPTRGGFTGGPLRTHPACSTVTAKSPQRPCYIVSTPTNLHQSYGRAAIHPLFGLSGDAPGVKEPTLVAKNATRMGHPPVRVLQFNQIHELGHSLDMITSGSIFGSSEGSADRLLNCIKSNY